MSAARVTTQWRGDEWLAQAFIPAGNAAIKDACLFAAKIVRDSMKPSAAPSMPGSPPSRHRGGLAKSIVGVGPETTGRYLVGAVGSSHISARIHEFGGTIRPKKQKALCYPLNKAAEDFARKRGGGVKAYGDGEGVHMRGVLLALMFQYNGRGAGHRTGRGRFKRAGSGYRFVFKSAGRGRGGVWGVVKRGGGRNADFIPTLPMFRVTKSVRIPARPYLRPLATQHKGRLQAFATNAFRTRLTQFSRRAV